jgi:hypothetical protein
VNTSETLNKHPTEEDFFTQKILADGSWDDVKGQNNLLKTFPF